MKYAILIGDGMSDYPVAELDNRTPLQVAPTPNMDFIAQKGRGGTVSTLLEGMPLGSDIANLNILGYDPRKYYTGRAPLEAASLEVNLAPGEIAFRCNLITVKEGVLSDFSAGHIPTEEASRLIQFLNRKMGAGKNDPGQARLSFYPGDGNLEPSLLGLKCIPPHDIIGEEISPNFPRGEGGKEIIELMKRSKGFLENHEINRRRKEKDLNPANMIWLWGQGNSPRMPTFKEKYNLEGAVITAVDLIKGIGKCIGLKVIDVPGATGYLDTNYEGKAEYALKALEEVDFVYLHVESPDEAGHTGKPELKIRAIKDFDQKVVGTFLKGLKDYKEYRIMVLPDHSTPLSVRTHTIDPVPFALYATDGSEKDEIPSFDEEALKGQGSLHFSQAHKLMDYFLAIG
jgi:2,3-bisphosphoglycerate-independent phosphoglycerate mutase